jgi:hypothetical protein
MPTDNEISAAWEQFKISTVLAVGVRDPGLLQNDRRLLGRARPRFGPDNKSLDLLDQLCAREIV